MPPDRTLTEERPKNYSYALSRQWGRLRIGWSKVMLMNSFSSCQGNFWTTKGRCNIFRSISIANPIVVKMIEGRFILAAVRVIGVGLRAAILLKVLLSTDRSFLSRTTL